MIEILGVHLAKAVFNPLNLEVPSSENGNTNSDEGGEDGDEIEKTSKSKKAEEAVDEQRVGKGMLDGTEDEKRGVPMGKQEPENICLHELNGGFLESFLFDQTK